jgi:hypothetical protein
MAVAVTAGDLEQYARDRQALEGLDRGFPNAE